MTRKLEFENWIKTYHRGQDLILSQLTPFEFSSLDMRKFAAFHKS